MPSGRIAHGARNLLARTRLPAVIGLFAVLAAGCAAASASTPGAVGGGPTAGFDPGNIISDQVFYDAAAMNASQIQAFLDQQNCSGPCLANSTYSWPGASVAWCQPVAPGTGSFAVMLATISVACGINPQVTLVVIEKESQGLDRPPPDALTGSHCPDSSGCDPAYSGVWPQTWGFVSAAAELHTDPSKVNYLEGQTHDILYNVPASCGSSPVLVQNRATATLYTWTPYQPNAASLATYPGTGDACSSYGNRNFFRMFQKFFGDTGGGTSTAVATGTGSAAGIVAAAATQLGVRYSWGGGDLQGPTVGQHDGGVADSYGDYAAVGWDCSALSRFAVFKATGVQIPRTAAEQRSAGQPVPTDFNAMQPGDLVVFGTDHVGVYAGNQQMIDAPESGTVVRYDSLTTGINSNQSTWTVRRVTTQGATTP